jgi:copper transport protein
MSRGRRALALVAVATGLAVLPAAPAQAHASIVGTTPSNGQQVSTRPDAVRVTFDEPVTLVAARSATVLDESGDRVDTGQVTLDAAGNTLTIPLEAGLPRGVFVASWSVLSADTHPVGGSIEFGYGQPPSPAAAAEPTGPSPALTLVVGLVKGALYLALIAAFGLVPAGLLLGAGPHERRGLARAARIGTAAAVVVSLVQVAVQQAWVASFTPGGGGTSVADVAGSRYAVAVWVRLAVLAAVLLVDARRARAQRRAGAGSVVQGLLALVVLATVAVDGHGGAGPWWRFLATTLHGAAAIAWLGGLAVLAWALLGHRLTPERLVRLGWWSVYAGAAVATLVASGTVQAVVGVRYPGALLTTTYGAVLLAKLVLVLVACGLGAAGLRWGRHQRRFERPEPGQTARLRARVRWEMGVASAVVVLSGVLSSVTPAEAAYAPTVTRHARVGPYAVTFEAGPARRGPESFRVTAVASTPDSPGPQTVRIVLRQDDGPVQGLHADVPYRIAGALVPGRPTPVTFASATVTVPATGRWTATVTVVAGEYEQYTAAFSYLVR